MMLLWFAASSISSIEVSEVKIETWTVYILQLEAGDARIHTGGEIPAGTYFLFPREETEQVAFALEEKELLKADYEALTKYAEELEKEASALRSAASKARKWNGILGAVLVGVSGAAVAIGILK